MKSDRSRLALESRPLEQPALIFGFSSVKSLDGLLGLLRQVSSQHSVGFAPTARRYEKGSVQCITTEYNTVILSAVETQPRERDF